MKGEILEGPTVGRHYVNVKLLYPYKQMPDPMGAKDLWQEIAWLSLKRIHL